MGVPTIIIPFLFGILHEINHPAIGDPANQAQVLLQELIKGTEVSNLTRWRWRRVSKLRKHCQEA